MKKAILQAMVVLRDLSLNDDHKNREWVPKDGNNKTEEMRD